MVKGGTFEGRVGCVCGEDGAGRADDLTGSTFEGKSIHAAAEVQGDELKWQRLGGVVYLGDVPPAVVHTRLQVRAHPRAFKAARARVAVPMGVAKVQRLHYARWRPVGKRGGRAP